MINTLRKVQKLNNRINAKIENFCKKAEFKKFDKDDVIQNFVKKIENGINPDYKSFNSCGDFCYFYDFKELQNYNEEYLKEYLQEKFYIYFDNGNNMFETSFFEVIGIDNRENSIYFSNMDIKSENFKSDLHAFLIIENGMYKSGCYPEIINLDYYGNYYSDYKIPAEYEFLKLNMTDNEQNKINVIGDLLELFKYMDDTFCIDDNKILSDVLPNCLQKIDSNLNLCIYNVSLDDNFILSCNIEINTKMKKEQAEKITKEFEIENSYTILKFNINIEEYLKSRI